MQTADNMCRASDVQQVLSSRYNCCHHNYRATEPALVHCLVRIVWKQVTVGLTQLSLLSWPDHGDMADISWPLNLPASCACRGRDGGSSEAGQESSVHRLGRAGSRVLSHTSQARTSQDILPAPAHGSLLMAHGSQTRLSCLL